MFETEEAEWRKLENWHGPFYFSRRDPRPFVPKRNAGMGITVNFAHPLGVVFLVGAILFAALLVFLARQS